MREPVIQSDGRWKDMHVDYTEEYSSGMRYYHAHDHYEISLILSGKMRILLEDAVHDSGENCLILTPAGAPHCIMHDPEVLYRRINMYFRESLIKGYLPEWRSLLAAFGEKGCVLQLSEAQSGQLQQLAGQIRKETDLFRRRLMLLLLLSQIRQLQGSAPEQGDTVPGYITGALGYIHSHYAEKIVAEVLAARLGVSRTTLMTGFRKHIGTTLNEYLTGFRLQEAIRLMRKGCTQQAAAESCGFSDACHLIRCFRRSYGTTPRRYLQKAPEST